MTVKQDRKKRSRVPGLLLAVLTLQGMLGAAASNGSKRENSSHPLGRITDAESQAHVAVYDQELPISDPLVAGERVVLTTVGTEHEHNGVIEFHPLLSVVIDETFSEKGDGQWLAAWNLGRKSPGFFSRLRALIPGFRASKRTPPGELRKLEQKLENFEALWEEGKIEAPKPSQKTTQPNRRSTLGLILSGIKRGLAFANVSYPARFLFGSYLLRRQDQLDRDFEQTFLGLTWYDDLAPVTEEDESLSPENIQDIKFQLLSNRHILGRWVDPRMQDELVHTFENELRDHLWGTSNYLASIANEYHLGYEELQRYTAGDVPLALGGILYYDPELAPEPAQVTWSTLNPFDLSYNPFSDPEVREAAAAGERVPLAIYVYQSNLALKPIIAIDFFRPGNPRLRESATYWRKVGNEALAATRIGLVYSLLRRALSFSANKKELTWFSDKKMALGIEEMRLSLISHLYFDPVEADQLLDELDRLILNPLVQPGRLQQVRARLHYQALGAEDGKAALAVARELREKRIRHIVGDDPKVLGAAQYTAYARYLERQRNLQKLEVSLNDQYLSSVPAGQLTEALQNLSDFDFADDKESMNTLMRFRLRMGNRLEQFERTERPLAQQARLLVEQTDRTLTRLYERSGRSDSQLQTDLALFQERQEEDRRKAELKWQKQHAGQFEKLLKRETRLLEDFSESGGDLQTYSPWYIARALEFFREVPEALQINPLAEEIYRPREAHIDTLLAAVEKELEKPLRVAQAEWMEDQRFYCLLSVQSARSELRASLYTSPSGEAKSVAGIDANNEQDNE